MWIRGPCCYRNTRFLIEVMHKVCFPGTFRTPFLFFILLNRSSKCVLKDHIEIFKLIFRHLLFYQNDRQKSSRSKSVISNLDKKSYYNEVDTFPRKSEIKLRRLWYNYCQPSIVLQWQSQFLESPISTENGPQSEKHFLQ